MFLPLGLHGDGGQFQQSDSIHVLSMRSLLSKLNVATSQLLLLALPKGAINKDAENKSLDTMTQVWQILHWSFDAIFYNKFPEMDFAGCAWPAGSWRASMAGQPLSSEGYKGFLYAIQADGEYLQNEFGLNGASCEQMCFNCGANKSTVPYNDFRAGAAWRSTVLKHCGTCPTKHVVTQVPGVVGETFKYDILHVLEEGLSANIIANCAFDFVVRPGWPGKQEERLKALFHKICIQYQEQGIDSSNWIRKLTMSTFCNAKSKHDHFPTLTGIKAKQVRYLVPVFLEICQEYQKPTDPYSVHRYKCIKNLNDLYQIMDECGMHPGASEAQAFKKCMDACLLHYSKLSVLTIGQGALMWNTIPKFHLAAHLADMFQWMNPKYYSCYGGETMVGLMAALGHSCLNGTAAWLVPTKVCWRYRLGFHLRNCGADLDLLDASESE